MKLTELLDTIQEQTKRTPEWDDPNFLSNLLLKLASYYATLGPILAQHEQDTDLAEMHYKITREQTKVDTIEQGKSVAHSESLAMVDKVVNEAHQDFVKLKYNSRLLFLARQGLDKNIDAIRSRLSYIKSDKEAQSAN